MLKNRPSEGLTFYGVAIAIILIGAIVFSLGIVEWLFNFFSSSQFVYPLGKILSGTMVEALGYIVLELELMRKKK